jgi:hypothetical protein
MLKELLPNATKQFRMYGCKALEAMTTSGTLHARSIFCSSGDSFKFRRPLATFCPVTCKCASSDPNSPAEHFCPLKDPSIKLPSSTWLPCDQLAVVSTQFPGNTSCSSKFDDSSPQGIYVCKPDYNGKNAYHRKYASVTWEVKWEKSSELGGAVIGNLNGHGGLAKWTFSSISESSRPLGDRHFYVGGNNMTVSSNNWLPVTAQNTNLTGGMCESVGPTANFSVQLHTGRWYLSARAGSCEYKCQSINKTCDVPIFEHMLSLHRNDMKKVSASISQTAVSWCAIPFKCRFPKKKTIKGAITGVSKTRSVCQRWCNKWCQFQLCWCSEQVAQ